MRTSYSRCPSLSFFIPSLSWEQKTKPTHSPYLHQHLKRSTTGLHIPRISSPLLALQDPATNREFNGAELVRGVMEVGEINAAGLLLIVWVRWDLGTRCRWIRREGIRGREEKILEKKLIRWAHNSVQNNYQITTEH